MNRKTTAIAGALLLIALAVALLLLRDGTDATSAAISISNAPGKTGKASSEAVLTIAPGMKRGSTRATGASKVSPLMQELLDSRNDKAIYDRLKAKSDPSGEELWAMARILERCGKRTDGLFPNAPRWGESLGTQQARDRFVASLSPKAPMRDKRVAAFDRMNFDPCKEFGELKITEKELRAAYERASAAGDPKGRIALLEEELKDQIRNEKGEIDVSNWSKPRILSDAQLETWKQVVASGDPRAVIDAMSVFTSSNLGNVHLRGADEAPIDGWSLSLAAMLAACDLGRDCGPGSQYLQQSCALEGACDVADLRDYLLFYSASPSRSQQIVQYHAGLMRVIRDNDWSSFTFAPGPAPGNAPFQRP